MIHEHEEDGHRIAHDHEDSDQVHRLDGSPLLSSNEDVLVFGIAVEAGHPFPTTLRFTFDPQWDSDSFEVALDADGIVAEVGRIKIEHLQKIAEAITEAKVISEAMRDGDG